MTNKAPQVVPERPIRREEPAATGGGADGAGLADGAGVPGEVNLRGGRRDWLMMEKARPTLRGGRRPSQQSYRIRSRRALMQSVGPRWAARTMKNSVKRTALAYTTSRTCMVLLALATLSSCLFYILATYLNDRRWVRLTETAYGIIFLADYCLTAVAAPVPLTYALSKGGVADLVSCLPAFGSLQPWMASVAFVRYLRVGKAIRVMRNHQLLAGIFPDDDVTIKATLLIVKVVGVVMMTSAILYGVERGLNDGEGTGSFNEPGWQWHDAFYFTIVTLSTVGYGDVLPISAFSRMLMVLVIIFALTYIPLEVGKLVDAINARPKYRAGFPRSLVGKQLHVVLAMSGGGAATSGPGETGGGGIGVGAGGAGASDGKFDCDMLERCVAEFFDDDQKASNVSVWVVVMAPTPPSEEISALCRQPKYRSRVLYFRGSVTNPRDMSAVCAEYADCIFLFPSPVVDGDTRAAQETTHLAAKALRRYIDRTPTDDLLMDKVSALSQTGNPRRTVVTVDEPHSKDQLLGFGIDHVICLGELKMSMLASATLCPALLPFVANSVRSCSHDGRRGSGSGGVGSTSIGNSSGRGGGSGNLQASINGGGASASHAASRNSNAFEEHEESGWLADYTRGTGFEVYSVPLEVLSENSSLWGMSFSRAARTMYDDSKGKVLLLAAVDHYDLASLGELSRHERVRRALGGGARSKHQQNIFRRSYSTGRLSGENMQGFGTAASAYASAFAFAATVGVGGVATGAESGRNRVRGQRKPSEAEADHFAKVDVFPDDNFRFTIDCHLLVLAETQTGAEDLIFNFQGKEEEEEDCMHGSGSTAARPSFTAGAAAAAAAAAARRPSLSTAAVAPMASDVTPGGVDAPAEDAFKAFASGPARPPPPPDAFSSLSSSSSRTSSSADPSSTPPSRSLATGGVVRDNGDRGNALPAIVFGDDTAGEENGGGGGGGLDADHCGGNFEHASASAASGTRQAQRQQPQHRQRRLQLSNRTFPSKEFLTSKALGSFQSSPATSLAPSTGSRCSALSMRPSILRKDDETKEELDLLEKEVFQGDEIDWTHALDALKRARLMLDDLDLDQGSADNPPKFFEKVAAVSRNITDALRLHTTSMPPDLSGHIVLLGGNSRLQHYIRAFRRQRPLIPIVVVTEDTVSFFELRDRLVEYKFLEMGLNIGQLYHVFGRTQDRLTLDEANVAEAESVMLMSGEHNDTAVLLGSFELEQVLEEILPGEPRPKVLIDLSKDDSIYYCGKVLGGTDNGPSSWTSVRSFDNEAYSARSSGGEDVRYWPLFAAGRVWTTSIMDVFAVRTYFNEDVLSFFETLLQIHTRHVPAAATQPITSTIGSNSPDDSEVHGGSEDRGGGDSHDDSAANEGRCQFAHLRVASSFAGKTYGDLTRHLISLGAMPLGLYRPTGTKGSTLAYTHINPSPQEPLNPWPWAPPPPDKKEPTNIFEEDDEDDDEAEEGKGGENGVSFSRGAKRSNGRGGDAGGRVGGGRGGRAGDRWKAGHVGMVTRAGDDVFVLRSRWCPLSGEVSL